MINGYNLTIGDLFNMQSLCAYETVALGSSQFCELFTAEEWGYEYANDLATKPHSLSTSLSLLMPPMIRSWRTVGVTSMLVVHTP